MPPFDPFAWFYSLMGFFQEQWKRLALIDRIGQTALVQRIVRFYVDFSVVPQLKDSALVEKARNSSLIGRIGSVVQFFLHISFVQPLVWITEVLGLSFGWLVSRQWMPIMVLSIPTIAMLGLISSAWWGGRIDRGDMAGHYFELGIQELDQQMALWNAAAVNKVSAQDDKVNTNQPAGGSATIDSNVPEESLRSRLQYAELLFNRSLLLKPVNQWKYSIGATMLDKGAIESGRKVLSPMAPSTSFGLPRAHAAMAISYLNEFNATNDQSLLPLLKHHAEACVQWGGCPREVYLALSAIYWQSGNQEQSVNILLNAAARFENINSVIYERAAAMGNTQLAANAKQKAVQELTDALAKDPSDVRLRIRLVQMMDTNRSGLAAAEKILQDGLLIEPHPLLSRALSEIYRIAFIRQVLEVNATTADLNLLDLALQIDPTNPLVADQIAQMVIGQQRPLEELVESLNKILASGSATIGTHAILAEVYLHRKNIPAAIIHLNQVYQAAPSAAKYTNHLVQLYAEQGRVDEAIQTGVNAVSMLDRLGLLGERYVDDLLHSLGTLFVQVQRYDDAISAFENILKFRPKRIDTRIELAECYRHVGNAEAAAAQEEYVSNQVDQSIQTSSPVPNPTLQSDETSDPVSNLPENPDEQKD